MTSKSNLDKEEKIRKYTKGRFLGKGGFAKCYEFICQDNNKIFAAKMLPLSDIKTERQKQKLLTEIKIHKSLHHQQIVAFEHYFKDNTNVYILLELCQIRALQYLHSHRVIHRDLKLGNLFLNDKMELKVGDFGLATKLDFEGERKKTVCGTLNYIAPEVLYGAGHSYEVDVWAIGVIIYTSLIGKPPFETRDVKTTYIKIKKADFSFPITSKISLGAKNIIKKILILDPKKRPTLNNILSDEFFNQGIAIPKLLPITTLALPLSIEYIKKYMPNAGNNGIINKEKSKINNIKRTNSGNIFSEKQLSKNNDNKIINNSDLVGTKDVVPNLLKNLKKEIYVTKWVDYSNKYGLGYILNNGYIGIYFNDTTKIVLNPIEKTFTYIDKKMIDEQELLYTFSMNEYPDEIKKKVYLFNQFKNYLDDENNRNKINEETILKNKEKEKEIEENEKRSKEKHKHKHKKKKEEKKDEGEEQNVNASIKNIEEIDFIFVKKWIKTKHAIIFRFSNKAIQICFKDRTEIFLHIINENITYTNKSGEKIVYPLKNSLNSSNFEMNKRVKYAKQVLTHMININKKKKDCNQIEIKNCNIIKV